MTRNALLIGLAGLASAVMFATLLGGPGVAWVVAYAAPLPLQLVGLMLGTSASYGAGGVALVLSLLLGGGTIWLVYALLIVGPSLLLVRQSLLWRADDQGEREWYPIGYVLAWLCVWGAGLTLLTYAALPDGFIGVTDAVRAAVDEGALALPDMGGVDIADLVRLAMIMTPASWLIMIVLNAILAEALAVRTGQAQRPGPAFATLVLPTWLGLGLGAAAVLSLLSGDAAILGYALMTLFATAYLLLGLAVVHFAVRNHPRRPLILSVLYAFLFLFAWPLAALFVLIGLVESVFQLRRRYA